MEKFIKQFSFIALENIFRELPNKITHSFNDINDIKPPKLMYPIFYGSYDWHSSVHSHWLLLNILKVSYTFSKIFDVFLLTLIYFIAKI